MRTATRALGKLLAQPHRPSPPSQPSCSRWLTCSCCRPATFFSPNAKEPLAKVLPRGLPPVDAEPPNPISKAHFLPLPPRLPYSPTSHPFKRHLEILSLSAISSTPEESWRIYLSLHRSLRRYIPDDLFRSLLNHQLSHPDTNAAWVRSRALIQYGQSCGMMMDAFGAEVVRDALRAGLAYALDVKGNAEGLEKILEGLWAALGRLKRGDLSRLDLETRRRWFEFQLVEVKRWGKRRWKSPRSAILGYPLRDPVQVIRDAVESKAAVGAEDLLESLLLANVGQESKEAVEVAILCWRSGVDISDLTVETLMQRLEKEGGDIEGVVREASRGAAKGVVERVESALLTALPLPERAAVLLAQPPPARVASLIQVGLKILSREPAPSDLDLVIDICQRLLSIRNSDAETLYHALAAKLDKASQHPSPPSSTIIRFSQTLLSASSDPTYLKHTLLSLIRLNSPEAYTEARTVYSVARPAGFKWSSKTGELGRDLLLRAIDPETRHLHFASRLYADLIADGRRPRRQDMLAMVRSIGMSRTSSRPILLERHLRDFIDFYPNHRGSLVHAMVYGLLYSRHPNDALLAWTLVKRLEGEVDPETAQSLCQCLATSTRSQHRQAMLEIVAAQSSSDTLPQLYDIFLTSLVHRANATPGPLAQSHEAALGLAGTVLRDMASKHISPSPTIATALIRGLVESDQPDNATELLRTVSKEGIIVKSSAIGRLMLRLVVAERYEDAEEVERMWRASWGTKKDVYDKGVVGARVVLDLKRGRMVDLVEVEKRTGWVGTKPFLHYLRSLGGDLREGAVKEESMEEVEDGAEAALEAMAFEGEREEMGEVRQTEEVHSGVRLGRYGAFAISSINCIAV